MLSWTGNRGRYKRRALLARLAPPFAAYANVIIRHVLLFLLYVKLISILRR